ncbi:hypothetical protein Ccrd_024362 [Cynara cardunculus var. scolymus]|uniref:Uncharacterized protein n=2 Tax=Cynara cardunculus var. scolymus TaxID=59895 RepID=A0A103XCL7_CYNCS|nr:hypothetical protein Ccrd_024362 [Cynara cardunculus var. scolymus]
MEANTCDAGHLDSNVLLPPRKRLLACMKKQNGDVSGNGNGNVNGNSYLPSTSSPMINFNTRINNMLSAHLSDDNPSQEEIVEAARSAAEVAVKIAIAARAAAQEKAVIATMAMAAAKKALELVAAIDEQETSSSSEQQLKKNKTKKRVEVQMLYDNKKPRVENDKTSDEELARQLHQVINSSPRISKYGSAPDLKDYEHKRLKIPTISENGRNNDQSVVAEENSPSSSNRNKLICERVAHIVDVDVNATKISKVDISESENGDSRRIHSKVKFGEDDSSTLGRKRGRMKQKKLPLSICHDRDQLNPKEDRRWRSSELVDKNIGKVTTAKDKSLLSVGPSANSVMPIERSSLWKCQSFKAAARLKQNKTMQS